MRQCRKTPRAGKTTDDNTTHAPSVNWSFYWIPHTVHNEDIQGLKHIFAEQCCSGGVQLQMAKSCQN